MTTRYAPGDPLPVPDVPVSPFWQHKIEDGGLNKIKLLTSPSRAFKDWVLAQILGDAFEHLPIALVAESVRVATTNRVVIILLALCVGIANIVLGQSGPIVAGGAANLLLLGAGGKLARVIAGVRGGGLLDTLFLVLEVSLRVCGTCAGYICASNCSPGMLHNTSKVPSIVLVVSDNTVFARNPYFRAVC